MATKYILCIGQSNMSGSGGEGPYVDRLSDNIKLWTSSGIINMRDPTSYYDVGLGTLIPQAANEVWNRNQADTYVWFNAAKPFLGYGTWAQRTEGSVYDLAISGAHAMTSGDIDYVVCYMGETEAAGGIDIYETTLAQANTLVSDMRTELGSGIVWINVVIGRHATSTNDLGYRQVRDAIRDTDLANVGTKTFYTFANDVSGMTDNSHLNQSALNTVGTRVGNIINYDLAGTGIYQHPVFDEDNVSLDETRTTITLPLSGALSYTSNASEITGLRFIDSQKVLEPTSVNISGTNLVAQTTLPICSGGFTVGYLDEASSDNDSTVQGEFGVNLGLEPNHFHVDGGPSRKSIYLGTCANKPSDFKIGSPTLTVSGGLGTFSVDQSGDLMGVGAKVTYGGEVSYVSYKISYSQWGLTDKYGNFPPEVEDVAVTSITHPFTTLSNTVNLGATLGTNDLSVSGLNASCNIACYRYDTDDTSANASWQRPKTTPTNVFKIFTPYDTDTECNVSQRSGATWDSSKFTWAGYGVWNNTNSSSQIFGTKHFIIEGLQFRMDSTGVKNIMSFNGGETGESSGVFRFNKIWASSNGSNVRGIFFSANSFLGYTIEIYNNIFFMDDTPSAGSYGIWSFQSAGSDVNIYNNTIYGFSNPVFVNFGNVNIKNNALINNTLAMSKGGGSVTDDYNVYTIDESEANGVLTTQTSGEIFTSVVGALETWDWTPAAGSDVVDSGVDLGSRFDSDMLHISGWRPQGSSWDIGAIELEFNAAPTAAGVNISGTAYVSEILSGIYIYSDSEGDLEGNSVYQWRIADDDGGTNLSGIAGATDITYTITESNVSGYILFEVIPVTDGGSSGIAYQSDYIGPVLSVPTPPAPSGPGYTIPVEIYVPKVSVAASNYSNRLKLKRRQINSRNMIDSYYRRRTTTR